MVGPVLISYGSKHHMWRLSITSIVGIQLQLNGFKAQRNYFIQNSSGGPSGHIHVNHNISFHLFQNFTTAEIIRHKLRCSGKAAKNSCIFHTFKFTCVHTRNHYFPVALWASMYVRMYVNTLPQCSPASVGLAQVHPNNDFEFMYCRAGNFHWCKFPLKYVDSSELFWWNECDTLTTPLITWWPRLYANRRNDTERWS